MLNFTYGTLPAPDQISQTFGCLLFGTDPTLSEHLKHIPAALPCVQVPMPYLNGMKDAPWFCETLHGNQPVEGGCFQDIVWRTDGNVLFGILQLDEFQTNHTHHPLQTTTKEAYLRIFNLLQAQGFPHVWRFWNYMPHINVQTGGLERYRQFNLGRQQAFDCSGQSISDNVPAACALGTQNGPLTIAFLAARQPSRPIENPRQVSAYDYPECYGPRSPLFSRASIASTPHGHHLFLSGTASIVGHETKHIGNITAQTQETLSNIRAVINEATQKNGIPYALTDLSYITYVRHQSDLQAVRTLIQKELGDKAQVAYLLADICRTDLLVEMEGFAYFGS